LRQLFFPFIPGTVPCLHPAPESAIAGPLAIVQTGDLIELDVPNRKLNLKVPQGEIQRRLSVWKGPEPHYDRGFGQLFIERILQANQGCDFDFLRRAPERGDPKNPRRGVPQRNCRWDSKRSIAN
jgi:dehydratase family protein